MRLAADVEIVAVLLSVLLHHRLDDAAHADGDLVAFARLAAEFLDVGEFVIGRRVVRRSLSGGRLRCRSRAY